MPISFSPVAHFMQVLLYQPSIEVLLYAVIAIVLWVSERLTGWLQAVRNRQREDLHITLSLPASLTVDDPARLSGDWGLEFINRENSRYLRIIVHSIGLICLLMGFP